MKITKKVLSLIISVILVFSVFSICAFATDIKTGSFNAMSFNVAGLPKTSALSGDIDATSVIEFINNKTIINQKAIGKFVNAGNYDIFATQEDFFYHNFLEEGLTNYNYSTAWQGGVPWGDGTTVFTKNFKMTGEEHIKWNSLSGDGSADDGADVYSRKGITYVCLEIADGVFVDFYDIHADAFGDEGSVVARKDNFKQLCDLIDEKDTGRPIIITGDFNISGHHTYEESGRYFTERFINEEGFKDAWTELYNDGNYTDFSKFAGYPSYWGVWDSVEKFLYRDGDNVKLTCDSFEYLNNVILNENYENVSDHAAITASFSYVATGEGISEEETVPETTKDFVLRIVFSFIDSLMRAFSNLSNILAYLGL